MKTAEAIKVLREMQSQIIHGSNTFGDIADLIEQLEVNSFISGELYAAEILAKSAPDGVLYKDEYAKAHFRKAFSNIQNDASNRTRMPK